MTTDPRSAHGTPDAFLDLVHGLLEDDERSRLLEHVGRCPDCEARLRATVATHERGRARAAEALAAGAHAPAAGPALAPPAVLPRANRSRSPWWAVAATIAVVSAAGWYASRGPSPETGGVRIEAGRLPAVDRDALRLTRSAAGADSLVPEGIEAYGRGDLARAVALLGSARAEGALEAMRGCYLASAQLAGGDARAALVTLEGVDESALPDPWYDENRWTRLVALDRLGRRATADSLARAIAAGSGPAAERAERYLRRATPAR